MTDIGKRVNETNVGKTLFRDLHEFLNEKNNRRTGACVETEDMMRGLRVFDYSLKTPQLRVSLYTYYVFFV